jgi:hypothetical protein
MDLKFKATNTLMSALLTLSQTNGNFPPLTLTYPGSQRFFHARRGIMRDPPANVEKPLAHPGYGK